MEIPRTVNAIQSLIDAEVSENLHLEYKRSRALEKSNKDEIAKDVSAMANADGGVIVYGVEERDHIPVRLDDGIDENAGPSREWIEQILAALITPPIGGIEVSPIPNKLGKFYFSIVVPKSTLAPHQAPDRKYYKRYNFRASPMDHYEILDVGNRRLIEPRLIDVRAEIDGMRHDVNLVIQNTGNRVARDLSFQFPAEFKWPSKRSGGEMPEALSLGIKYFPPDRRISFSYCSTMDVGSAGVPQEFEVQVTYLPEGRVERITETILISLSEFSSSLFEYSGLDRIARQLETGLRDVARSIHDPIRSLMRPPRPSPPKEPSFRRWQKNKK
jgi:hypothetical protein